MPAIADVARLAGVSKATASRALSGRGYVAHETRDKVRQAANDIGYIASPNAASLVTGRTKNVGVVIPLVNRWFFADVLEGIERALLAREYDLTLYNVTRNGPERDRVFAYFLQRKRVDAVITVGVDLTDAESAQLARLGKPIVAVGDAHVDAITYTIDDESAAREATSHLIELGHKHIVHLGGKDDSSHPDNVSVRRRAGYVAALSAASLGRFEAYCDAELTMPSGYTAALELLQDPTTRPTAVFAACDELAFGTILAAQKLGIPIPDKLSVVGIDGHEYAEIFGLTTIAQQPAAQGQAAVEAVLNALESAPAQPVDARVRLFPSVLVERSSTARPHNE